MLTLEQIQANKMAFIELLGKLDPSTVNIPGFCQYLDYVDYFNKPATAKEFKAYPGGLCEYALELYNELDRLNKVYFNGGWEQAIIIEIALLRDLYRAVLYEPYVKQVYNHETQDYEDMLFFKVADNRPTFGDIGMSSYMIAKDYFNLSNEIAMPIIYGRHTEGYTKDLCDILRRFPLVALVRMADLGTTISEVIQMYNSGGTN